MRREKEIVVVKDRHSRVQAQRLLPNRLLTRVDILRNSLPIADELLAGFCGINKLPAEPVLMPVSEATKLIDSLQQEHYVPGINSTLTVHPEVLVPRSKETIDLMLKAMASTKHMLPIEARILDMGCGSGVLSIAAAIVYPQAQITATDILPEAVSTTMLNAQRLESQGIISGNITTTSGGDLFEPVRGQSYDLLIFNAPWVVAPAHNRAELALNDANQGTISRFLNDCTAHMTENSRVIVGYADNSGPKAIARLEELINNAGLEISQVFKDRIKTYRAKRSWQTIYAYVLKARN